MPPKKGTRKSGAGTDASGTATPNAATLLESHTYMYTPRPFKNPNYTKNVNRRMKNYKAVLAAERERERLLRETQRQQIADGIEGVEDVPPTYLSIEAPPSVLPQPHYCDITGLEGPYTDPATGLRYHDKSVYEFIRGMNPGTEKFYLSARGVNPIVK